MQLYFCGLTVPIIGCEWIIFDTDNLPLNCSSSAVDDLARPFTGGCLPYGVLLAPWFTYMHERRNGRRNCVLAVTTTCKVQIVQELCTERRQVVFEYLTKSQCVEVLSINWLLLRDQLFKGIIHTGEPKQFIT